MGQPPQAGIGDRRPGVDFDEGVVLRAFTEDQIDPNVAVEAGDVFECRQAEPDRPRLEVGSEGKLSTGVGEAAGL